MLHDDLTSIVEWQKLNVSSSIGHMGLNDDNLHPDRSSKPLIEDQPSNPTTTHTLCLFIFSLFDGKYILRCLE